MPFCPRCGTSVEDDDLFCSSCGHKLRKNHTPIKIEERTRYSIQPSLKGLSIEAIKSIVNPSHTPIAPSQSVYAKRPHSPLKRYVLSAIILISLGLFLSYGEAWLTYVGFTFSGFTAPVLILIWMTRNDRFEREPWPLIAVTFGWGVFCGIFAAILNVAVAIPIFGTPGAAIIEEPIKLLGVLWLAKHKRLGVEFNDHLDGLVYGAAAGAGFAGLENLYYIMEMTLSGGIPPLAAIAVRSATSICHIAWSAIAGRSIGWAKALRGYTKITDIIPALMVVIPMHFIWNASFPGFDLLVMLPFFIVVLYRQIKASQLDEARWGYKDSAPVEIN